MVSMTRNALLADHVVSVSAARILDSKRIFSTPLRIAGSASCSLIRGLPRWMEPARLDSGQEQGVSNAPRQKDG